MSAPWTTVPVSSLPTSALNLRTYPPDASHCVKGHRFESEADCVLPEDEDGECWDQFLCRRCVDWMRTYGRER